MVLRLLPLWALFFFLSLGITTHAQSAIEDAATPNASLTLAVERDSYVVGERISISYTLENAGTRPFYANPEVRPLLGWDAGVQVSLFDSGGRKVPGSIGSHLPIPEYDKTNLVDWITKRWLVMQPGSFYGMHTHYFSGCNLAPGKYQIIATYFSRVLTKVTPAQKESLKHLEYPALAGTIASNPVWVEIKEGASGAKEKTCDDLRGGESSRELDLGKSKYF